MRALITGGAGFIGSHLAEALLAGGHQVSVIDDLSTGQIRNLQPLFEYSRFAFFNDRISNEVLMDRLVSECDMIFHLAAAVGVELIIKSPVRVIETNVLGTNLVLRLANRNGKKVLLASTSEIYGKGKRQPLREDDDRVLGPTTTARWSYSASKAVDEFLALAYCREKGLEVVIFRLFNTIGPRQTGRYGMVVPRFVEQALTGISITVYGDGKQTRCFCNVSDVVRAIIGLAGDSGAVGEVFNIGSEEELTILEVAMLVRDLAGSDAEIAFIPYEKAYGEGFEDMRRRVPSIEKIRDLTGWKPTISLEETLGQIIEYHSDRSAVAFRETVQEDAPRLSQQ
ncbi:MAG: GDP-mannose 4,6-dehydratase [Anaerolineales bacterium]